MARKPNVPPVPAARPRAAAAHVQTAVRAAQAKLADRPPVRGVPPPVQAAPLPAPRAQAPHVKAATAAIQGARPPHPPRPLPPAARPRTAQAALARPPQTSRAATKSVIQRRKIPLAELDVMIGMFGPPGPTDDANEYHFDVIRMLNTSLRGVTFSAAGRSIEAEGIDDDDRKTVESFVKYLQDYDVFNVPVEHRAPLFAQMHKAFFAAGPSAVVEVKALPVREAKISPAWLAESKKPMHSTLYVYNGHRWTAKSTATGTTSGHVEQQAYNSLLAGAADAKMAATYKASWVGFVQNAPPCPEECRAVFSTLSSTVTGFIFYVIGDHGGYCKNYDVVTDTPFYLVFHNGSMTRVRPGSAPASGPP